MKSKTMLAFILALASALGVKVIAAPAEGAPLASCPGEIRFVQVEADAGKYDPPAYLVPAWDNGKEGKELYSEWTDVENQNVMLHCHLEHKGVSTKNVDVPLEVVKVPVPAEATKCVRFRNQVSCFVAPVKSDRANPSPAN